MVEGKEIHINLQERKVIIHPDNSKFSHRMVMFSQTPLITKEIPIIRHEEDDDDHQIYIILYPIASSMRNINSIQCTFPK
jgi:hypothetical protein